MSDRILKTQDQLLDFEGDDAELLRMGLAVGDPSAVAEAERRKEVYESYGGRRPDGPNLGGTSNAVISLPVLCNEPCNWVPTPSGGSVCTTCGAVSGT